MDVQRQMIFRALAALHEAVVASKVGPIAPTLSLAFVFSYLASVQPSVRGHGSVFYRAMQMEHPDAYSAETASTMRSQEVSAAFTVIIRTLGLPSTPAMWAAMAEGANANARKRKAACDAFWLSVDQLHSSGSR